MIAADIPSSTRLLALADFCFVVYCEAVAACLPSVVLLHFLLVAIIDPEGPDKYLISSQLGPKATMIMVFQAQLVHTVVSGPSVFRQLRGTFRVELGV